MPRVSNGLSLVALATSIAFAGTSPVWAQAAASPPVETAEPAVVDIVVTAQRRAERVNDIPMTISAFSGQQLARMGVTQPEDLAKVVPGLVYTKSSYGSPVYTLRGVGFYDYSLAATPAVTVYVDEVPLPFSRMASFAGLDVARVEVLKGPQGTLYGVNSTGGAVNFIAEAPSRDFHVGGTLSYGRFNEIELKSYVGGPISSSLLARLSLSYQRADDWQRSYTRRDSNGRKNVKQARLLLNWAPTDRLTMVLNANGGNDKSDAQAGQFQGISPIQPTNTTVLTRFPALYNYPIAPDNARAADFDIGRSLRINNRQWQVALTGKYDLTDDIQFTSISSFVKFIEDQPIEADGTPFLNTGGTLAGNIKSFYQELRLQGTLVGGLNWIVGGNYEHDRMVELQNAILTQSSIGSYSINQSDQKNTSKAVYGRVEYAFAGGLSVFGGVRYTDQSRTFAGCTRAGDQATATRYTTLQGLPIAIGACATKLADGTLGVFRTRLAENNVSWTAGARYKINADTMLYATISRGYKGGSFPIVGALTPVSYRPVRQENILAYEAGYKVALADRVVQLNGAAFYYDYTNKQVCGKFIDPVSGFAAGALTTVPKSEVYGAEAQLTIRPSRALTLGVEGTYTKAKIKGSFVNFDFFGRLANFGGQPLPFSPKWSLVSHINYETDINADWKLVAGANARYQSRANAALGNLPQADIKSYATLDLRLGVAKQDDRLGISIYGRNVTNTYYWTNVNAVIDTITRYSAMPATYGVMLGYRY
ncbi:TonB-denpendent receptor [Sphingobium baderi LL03]|nr:TonB-denpendent receptor [Sphingobium baderi LL03]